MKMILKKKIRYPQIQLEIKVIWHGIMGTWLKSTSTEMKSRSGLSR